MNTHLIQVFLLSVSNKRKLPYNCQAHCMFTIPQTYVHCSYVPCLLKFRTAKLYSTTALDHYQEVFANCCCHYFFPTTNKKKDLLPVVGQELPAQLNSATTEALV